MDHGRDGLSKLIVTPLLFSLILFLVRKRQRVSWTRWDQKTEGSQLGFDSKE